VVCANKFWWICKECKIWGDSTPKGRNVISKKCPLGWVNMSPYNSSFVDQSSPHFFIQRGRGCSWANTFRICDTLISSGDIHDQIWKLDVLSSSQILGGKRNPSKSYTHFVIPDSRHVVWKKFCEDTPTSPEVIGDHTVNFKQNIKFSRLKFFGGGGPLPVRMCASRAWSTCNACKNFRAQHPLMAKLWNPKNAF